MKKKDKEIVNKNLIDNTIIDKILIDIYEIKCTGDPDEDITNIRNFIQKYPKDLINQVLKIHYTNYYSIRNFYHNYRYKYRDNFDKITKERYFEIIQNKIIFNQKKFNIFCRNITYNTIDFKLFNKYIIPNNIETSLEFISDLMIKYSQENHNNNNNNNMMIQELIRHYLRYNNFNNYSYNCYVESRNKCNNTKKESNENDFDILSEFI